MNHEELVEAVAHILCMSPWERLSEPLKIFYCNRACAALSTAEPLIRADERKRTEGEIVAWLGRGSVWLNGGECCGDKDSDGVCAAPACLWGEELKLLHSVADAIEAGDYRKGEA